MVRPALRSPTPVGHSSCHTLPILLRPERQSVIVSQFLGVSLQQYLRPQVGVLLGELKLKLQANNR